MRYKIAKSFGAEVTGVDNTSKLAMLLSLGADQVIDYTKEDFTQHGQHYDLILDVVGNRSIVDYKSSLSPNGTYVMVGGSMARIFQVMFLGAWISMIGSKKMGLLIHKPNKNDQNFMKELFEAGKVVSVIDRRYPLSEVAEALRYLGEGYPKGKVVIRVEH
ncbi:NAD(P)-dependent alcohol dehydrogenase [Paenibacillus alginolyticus]|uniref:NAD(P)-dependent alcohol dehydrogenase n=1 Tax=Paenibacillus alginolyticus TaxID=59839 RepID=UPI00041CF9DB|nr:NAD(P)-dependent alcohol dehydrogenase [Paenibacillus alginolyticus]